MGVPPVFIAGNKQVHLFDSSPLSYSPRSVAGALNRFLFDNFTHLSKISFALL